MRVFGGAGDDTINYKTNGADDVHLVGGEGFDSANISARSDSSFDIVGDEGKVLYEHRGGYAHNEVYKINVREMENIRVSDRGQSLFEYDSRRRTRRQSRFS